MSFHLLIASPYDSALPDSVVLSFPIHPESGERISEKQNHLGQNHKRLQIYLAEQGPVVTGYSGMAAD